MTRQSDAPDRRTSRRSFLSLVGLAAGAGATTSASAEALPTFRASGTADGSARQFTIEQGGRCLPVTPLSYGSDTITDFYAYSREDYESHTKTGLEASDVSQLFLYEDPDGRISLGIIHDAPEGSEGTGGAATFSFAGLSADGEWLVRNDDYDGANEIWETSANHEGDTVHWAWNKWHSDGGVFGGLGAEFDVTIEPAFNGTARLDPGTPGEISEWQFVSGDAESPDRITLDLDEPLTIRTGACDTGGNTTVPDEVSARLDVKPGTNAPVDPRSRGRLPVAVLSTDSFDATAIDPETIAFGPDGAAPVHVTETDANGDGRADLLVHFRMAATGIGVNTTHVTLNAKTTDGTRVYGTERLDIPANRDDDEEKREHEAEHEHTETEERETEREHEEKETEREREEKEVEHEHEEKETEREHEGEREKRKEKREEKREKREEKREKREEKREKRKEKREEKREKREEKREKRKEKREEKRGRGRGKGKKHDDDDDEDEDE